MDTILLSIGILVVLACAVVNLRRAKFASSARRADLRNNAGMFLSIAGLWGGAWIGGMIMLGAGVPVIGWLLASCIAFLALALMIAGVAGALSCIRRVGRIDSQLDTEISSEAFRR